MSEEKGKENAKKAIKCGKFERVSEKWPSERERVKKEGAK